MTLSSFQATFPVCEDGRVIGLLTYPQMVQALNEQQTQTLVRDAMVTDIPTVSPSDPLIEVRELFAQSQLDAVPVVADGQFLGLITNRDLGEVYNLVAANPDLLPRTAS